MDNCAASTAAVQPVSWGAAPLPLQQTGEQARGGADMTTAALQSDMRTVRRKGLKILSTSQNMFPLEDESNPSIFLALPMQPVFEKYHLGNRIPCLIS